MKKDIEWAIKEVEGLETETSQNYPHDEMVEKEIVLGILNQLDEPEVLSQEWITENSVEGDFRGIQEFWYGEFIEKEKLQNLLVPKQEKVEVPRFVADILEENTFADLPTAFEELFSANAGHYYGEDVCKWIVSNEEAFARAWLDGYTVEEEQKYVVPVGENHALCKFTNDAWGIYKEDIDKLYLDDDFKFTEQEIKDYDPRYLAFKVKVEEPEE